MQNNAVRGSNFLHSQENEINKKNPKTKPYLVSSKYFISKKRWWNTSKLRLWNDLFHIQQLDFTAFVYACLHRIHLVIYQKQEWCKNTYELNGNWSHLSATCGRRERSLWCKVFSSLLSFQLKSCGIQGSDDAAILFLFHTGKKDFKGQIVTHFNLFRRDSLFQQSTQHPDHWLQFGSWIFASREHIHSRECRDLFICH